MRLINRLIGALFPVAVNDVAARPLREAIPVMTVAVLPNGIDPAMWKISAHDATTVPPVAWGRVLDKHIALYDRGISLGVSWARAIRSVVI
ncbi:MAG: hypothetical protein H7288_24130 [Kineosporiaceae bacterium]|nr:hypothetical protein [Aeromicrobium sp.]